MRFTFLGTGTSSGVPAIGMNDWSSDDPRDRRLRTSAALRWTDPHARARTVLLDCGPDIRQQALTQKLDRCDAILFTHNHVDHTWGLDEVRRFNVTMQGPIDIYAEENTLEHLYRVYAHIFEKHKNINDSFVASLITHRMGPERTINLYGLNITPFRLLHGRLPVLGFRIDSDRVKSDCLPLAYCTDVSAIPPESWRHLTGLKTLVLDALRHRKHPTHFTLGQAVSVAAEVEAEQTWFVHMNHEIRHAETDAELPEGMNLAFDGLTI